MYRGYRRRHKLNLRLTVPVTTLSVVNTHVAISTNTAVMPNE
jgi:hypothetical protein